MGDRGNISFVFSNKTVINFYTHHAGSQLMQTLRNALIRGESRWHDECYLARIIFSEMIKDDILGETGFGISPYVAGDLNNVNITVRPADLVIIRNRRKTTFQDFCST